MEKVCGYFVEGKFVESEEEAENILLIAKLKKEVFDKVYEGYNSDYIYSPRITHAEAIEYIVKNYHLTRKE